MRLARLILGAAVAVLLSAGAAGAQTPVQGGPWTAGHAPMYSGSGGAQPVIQDSGPAGGGTIGLGLSELLLQARGTGTPPYSGQGTGPFGSNLCDYDAPIDSAGGYHYLCLTANATGGGGLISYGSGGTAIPGSLQIAVNGVIQPLGVAATLPLVISAGVLSLNYDASFALTGGTTLGLAPIADSALLGNVSGSSNEPVAVSPSAWFNHWCSTSADEVPYTTGASTWGCLQLLGAPHTWAGTQTFSTPISVPSGGTGAASFTSNAPLIGNGGSAIGVGSRSGSTTVFATSSGVLTNGDCVSINAGNYIDAGGPCTTGGGGGTVSSATINQLAYYAASGTTVSGLATANNGTLITSSGGVPSISSTLPATVQGNITAVGTIASGTWQGTLVAATYGGTGNAFFAVSGPASTIKTFTFPNSSATVLTSATQVTVAQGGTGVATLTNHAVLLGQSTSNVSGVTLADAALLIGQGAADPQSVAVSGDCTLADTGAITCTKSSGVVFGTAAFINVGTSANNIVRLNASAQLPAVDGSLLTNLPSSNSWTQIGGTTNTTSGTTVSITSIPSGFQQLVVRLNGVGSSSSGASVSAAVSVNNGSSYGGSHVVASVSGSVNMYGYFIIDAAGVSGLPKNFSPMTSSGSANSYNTPATDTATTGVVNAIRLTVSLGSFNSGSITLWGID